MSRTIQCDQCGIVLNLPDNAGGKRLKCPKCGHKFHVDPDTSNYPKVTKPSAHDASLASSLLVPPPHGDESLPTASGDLRDTFDLPLLSPVDEGPAPAARSQTSDALALFEDKKSGPRRTGAAEARSKARRCPTCGSVVAAGMSVCSKCGLDLESGARVHLDDDDLLPAPPPRPSGPPMPVTVIALVALLGSTVLTLVSLALWKQGQQGWLYFVPVCLFGAFAAVHLLRGHTAKLLLAALSLGAMVDVVALIAMPIFEANEETKIVHVQPNPDDPDGEPIAIESVVERLNSRKITWGIALLLSYAAVCIYLLSPGVRRHYAART